MSIFKLYLLGHFQKGEPYETLKVVRRKTEFESVVSEDDIQTNRKTEDYKGMSIDSILSHTDAVICYRVITGACRPGIKYFIEDVLKEKRKEEYTISEIIELTAGQYRSDVFASFFEVTP